MYKQTLLGRGKIFVEVWEEAVYLYLSKENKKKRKDPKCCNKKKTKVGDKKLFTFILERYLILQKKTQNRFLKNFTDFYR